MDLLDICCSFCFEHLPLRFLLIHLGAPLYSVSRPMVCNVARPYTAIVFGYVQSDKLHKQPYLVSLIFVRSQLTFSRYYTDGTCDYRKHGSLCMCSKLGLSNDHAMLGTMVDRCRYCTCLLHVFTLRDVSTSSSDRRSKSAIK